jgi:aminoglycoside phosphotransferase family enzyme
MALRCLHFHPQKFRMDHLIKADKLSLKTIDRLTRILVKFHSSTRTNAMIKNYGLPNFLKKKIDEKRKGTDTI